MTLALKSIEEVFAALDPALAPFYLVGIAAVGLISGIVVIGRKTTLSLLCLVVCSLVTLVANEAVAGAAYLGRYYFAGLTAVTALLRPAPGHPVIVALFALWAGLNLAGAMYTPYIEAGLARGVYFLLACPAFMLSMAPPLQTPDSLIRLLRRIATAGVLLAIGHVVFIVVVPQRAGVERLTSFFVSTQMMAMVTGTVSLVMIWALLSKNAGKVAPFILGGVIINLLIIIASTQRAPLFALFGGAFILMIFYRVRGALVAGVGVAAVAVLAGPVIYVLVSQSYLSERVFSMDTTGRSYFWSLGFAEAMKSPVIGQGSGAATFFSAQNVGMKFHQAYLAVFFDFGIPGVLLFVAMIGMGAWTAFRLTRRGDAKVRSLGVFSFAAISMCAALGLVETGLADTANQTATLFYLALGIAAAVSQRREGASEREVRSAYPAAVRPTWRSGTGFSWDVLQRSSPPFPGRR